MKILESDISVSTQDVWAITCNTQECHEDMTVTGSAPSAPGPDPRLSPPGEPSSSSTERSGGGSGSKPVGGACKGVQYVWDSEGKCKPATSCPGGTVVAKGEGCPVPEVPQTQTQTQTQPQPVDCSTQSDPSCRSQQTETTPAETTPLKCVNSWGLPVARCTPADPVAVCLWGGTCPDWAENPWLQFAKDSIISGILDEVVFKNWYQRAGIPWGSILYPSDLNTYEKMRCGTPQAPPGCDLEYPP
jgi:hypothetical protein